jgi:hypothetical protein
LLAFNCNRSHINLKAYQLIGPHFLEILNLSKIQAVLTGF